MKKPIISLFLSLALFSATLAQNNDLKNTTNTHVNKQDEICIDGVPLFINWANTRFEAGDTAVGEIILGTIAEPADSIYSIAFRINYDNLLVQQNSLAINFDTTWLTSAVNPISTVDDFWQQGRVDVFYSKNDQQNGAGSGQIGSIIIIIDDNIQGIEVGNETIAEAIFSIDSVITLSFEGDTVPVCGEESIFAAFQIILSTNDLFNEKFSAYPNPTSASISIKSEKSSFNSLRIINTLGQVVIEEKYENSTHSTIDVSSLIPGTYFLELMNNKGEKATSKISILK